MQCPPPTGRVEMHAFCVSFIVYEWPPRPKLIQLLDVEEPTAGDARPDVSAPLDFPFPSTDDAPSSSYKPWASMYSITGAGIRYCTLISLLKNNLIFVELTSFWISCAIIYANISMAYPLFFACKAVWKPPRRQKAYIRRYYPCIAADFQWHPRYRYQFSQQ